MVPISASQVARITGMSHWCLAVLRFEFSALHLLGKSSTTWVTYSRPFLL
jgi:hypothetical protein